VAVNCGGAWATFELNVFKPLIIQNFLQSVRLLADGAVSFNDQLRARIEPDAARIKKAGRRIIDAGDRAQPAHRYDKAAPSPRRRTRRAARSQRRWPRDMSTSEQFDQWVRPRR